MIVLSVALSLSILLGLWRVLMGPRLTDRILALQLTTTTGAALLLILAVLSEHSALLDVALVLAVLSTLISIALTQLLRNQRLHHDV